MLEPNYDLKKEIRDLQREEKIRKIKDKILEESRNNKYVMIESKLIEDHFKELEMDTDNQALIEKEIEEMEREEEYVLKAIEEYENTHNSN